MHGKQALYRAGEERRGREVKWHGLFMAIVSRRGGLRQESRKICSGLTLQLCTLCVQSIECQLIERVKVASWCQVLEMPGPSSWSRWTLASSQAVRKAFFYEGFFEYYKDRKLSFLTLQC